MYNCTMHQGVIVLCNTDINITNIQGGKIGSVHSATHNRKLFKMLDSCRSGHIHVHVCILALAYYIAVSPSFTRVRARSIGPRGRRVGGESQGIKCSL